MFMSYIRLFEIKASSALKRLKLNRFVFFVIRFFCRRMRISETEVEEAMDRLSGFYPDPGSGCVWNNPLDIKSDYDLTVIIPVYNVEKYLRECLDSVLSQKTRYRYRILAVNDGSTDSSLEILRSYGELLTVIDRKNGGLSAARNSGLKELDSKYVMFLDSDDILPDGTLELLMDSAIESDSDIVGGGFRRFSENGVLYESLPAAEDRINGFVTCKVMKSVIFERICFPKGYWFEDTIVAFLFEPDFKTRSINTVVHGYRYNPQSITSIASHANVKKVMDTVWVTAKLLEERVTLGMQPNQLIYKAFLQQLKTNYSRVCLLLDGDIDRCVFAFSCSLFDRYFKNFNTDQDLDSEMKLFQDALQSRNYAMYKYACLLL